MASEQEQLSSVFRATHTIKKTRLLMMLTEREALKMRQNRTTALTMRRDSLKNEVCFKNEDI